MRHPNCRAQRKEQGVVCPLAIGDSEPDMLLDEETRSFEVDVYNKMLNRLQEANCGEISGHVENSAGSLRTE